MIRVTLSLETLRKFYQLYKIQNPTVAVTSNTFAFKLFLLELSNGVQCHISLVNDNSYIEFENYSDKTFFIILKYL